MQVYPKIEHLNCKARLLPSQRPSQGFTLIEILVVVFIIGVIVGFAVLSTGNPHADNLKNEARRLHAVLELAAEEAVIFGTELGLDLSRSEYQFLRLDADGWTPLTDQTSPLRRHKLKEPAQIRLLELEEDRGAGLRRPDQEQGEREQNEGPRPEVLFLSSGEILPFALQLLSDPVGRSYLIKGELTGKLSLRAEDRE